MNRLSVTTDAATGPASSAGGRAPDIAAGVAGNDLANAESRPGRLAARASTSMYPVVTMDPDHPILPDARRYEVIALHWDRSVEEPYLELTLRHTDALSVRRLRFLSPRDLHVDPGIAAYQYGFAIANVRARQMEGLGVEVYNFEGFGGVRFFARDVIDVTDSHA